MFAATSATRLMQVVEMSEAVRSGMPDIAFRQYVMRSAWADRHIPEAIECGDILFRPGVLKGGCEASDRKGQNKARMLS